MQFSDTQVIMSIIISFQEKSHLNDRFPLNECFKFSRKILLSPPPDLQGQQLFQHLLLRRDIAQGQPLDNLAVFKQVLPHGTRKSDCVPSLYSHFALQRSSI